MTGADWIARLPRILQALEAGPLAGKKRKPSRENGGRGLRYGARGSLRVTLEGPQAGTWRDHEGGTGGGVLAFVEHALGCDRGGALRWLEAQGCIEAATNGAHQPPGQRQRPARRPGNAGVSQPTRPAESAPTANVVERLERARRLLRASGPIPLDAAHPARRWLAARHLWRPTVALPPWVRWIEAAAIHPDHQGAGAVIVPAAPLADWAAAAPDWPRGGYSGVQVVHVDAAGAPALDRGEADGGLSKRSHGSIAGAVLAIGDLRPGGPPPYAVTIAEGLADALALAARRPEPALATFGASGMGPDLAAALAAAGVRRVTIAPDPDPGGLAAQTRLALALAAHAVDVRVLDLGRLDPAAAARPFADVDDGGMGWAAAVSPEDLDRDRAGISLDDLEAVCATDSAPPT